MSVDFEWHFGPHSRLPSQLVHPIERVHCGLRCLSRHQRQRRRQLWQTLRNSKERDPVLHAVVFVLVSGLEGPSDVQLMGPRELDGFLLELELVFKTVAQLWGHHLHTCDCSFEQEV